MALLTVTLGVLAATAAPVPPPGTPLAPPPHEWKPDATLILTETVIPSNGKNHYRVLRVDFRNGVARTPEILWEDGDRLFYPRHWYSSMDVVANRYLLSGSGAVLDIATKRLISKGFGDCTGVFGLKVCHESHSAGPDAGRYEFDISTETLTRIGDLEKPMRPWYEHTGALEQDLSPDGQKVVVLTDGGEMILHRKGQKQKSLGKRFTAQHPPPVVIPCRPTGNWAPQHAGWIDDHHILSQLENGKLVMVALDGTVTDLVTIPEAQGRGVPFIYRENTERMVYSFGRDHFYVDINTKSFEKTDWRPVGNGFERHRYEGKRGEWKLRYKGSEIGECRGSPPGSKTTPGYLAVGTINGESWGSPDAVKVWSAAIGDWTLLLRADHSFLQIVGWLDGGSAK